MLTAIVIGALSAAALVQQTDTIVQANGASRLSLDSFQGEVVVATWDRDAVQVQTDRTDDRAVRIRRSGSTILVGSENERGMGLAHVVNYRITVPRRFALNIEGVALDVDIQGSEGPIDVTTVHGPIRVQGGRESVSLESVNGSIHLEGAEGNLEVSGVAGGVTIVNCSGNLNAQSVGGDLTIEGITSRDVEAGTVGGTLRFEGGIQDSGRYTFGSHGGEIWLSLPSDMNARVDALTLAGSIEVDFPGAPSEPTRSEGFPGFREKRLTFEAGSGSARIEIETFGGTVHIRRQGG